MSLDIAPGTKISLKVVKRPTNAAAAKTIVRLLRKDDVVKTEDARLRKARKVNFSTKPRGGRPWNQFVPVKPAVKPVIGAHGTIVATLDVLTDLQSVSKFVEVKPA